MKPKILHRLWRRTRADRGSAAPGLELIIITPMILLIILVGVAAGRTATGQSRVQQAAAAAARAATTTHTATAATHTAEQIATDNLAEKAIDCTTLDVTVDATGLSTPPGMPAHVTVTIDCTVAWSDLAIPGWPGSHVVTATAASPLDPRREIP